MVGLGGGMLKSLYTAELSFMLRGTNVGPSLEAALPPYIGDALRRGGVGRGGDWWSDWAEAWGWTTHYV